MKPGVRQPDCHIMSAPQRPQLRPHLAVETDGREGCYILTDQLRLAERQLHVTALELSWLRLFDGRNTLRDIQAEVVRRLGGQLVPLEVFDCLASRLDEALFLDGPRFRARYREVAELPVRPPSCLGSYEAEPHALRRQVERQFNDPGGPGLPGPCRHDPHFRGALVPHIDYGRGGRSFAWTFKEVRERTAASLFVIVGTSHYSRHRFTLTRKHFQTPLGIAPTDQGYIDRLVIRYGDGLFDDELMAHLPEHSIELEVVFLQYLFADCPFRIVPLVVGSFQDAVRSGRDPGKFDDIGRMVEALRAVERETPEPICYLISGDLAHLGPKFGDPRPVHTAQLMHSRRRDEDLMQQASRADTAGYFGIIAEEGDSRRICGLPPTYTVLEAVRPSAGKLLHYDQWIDPGGYESVSFAGMAFYQ
jgi:AmmeMemoRadiSam system protein B